MINHVNAIGRRPMLSTCCSCSGSAFATPRLAISARPLQLARGHSVYKVAVALSTSSRGIGARSSIHALGGNGLRGARGARRTVVGAASLSGASTNSSAAATADAVSELTDQLRLLETERDEAVKTGVWGCAGGWLFRGARSETRMRARARLARRTLTRRAQHACKAAATSY